MIPVIKYVLVLILLILGLYTDTKSYKIKNSVIISFVCAGLIVNYVYSGVSGVGDWIIGFTLPILVLFILFILRMLGAGDIKLIATIGGILGIQFLIDSSIYILIAASIMALFKMLIKRNLKTRLNHFFTYLLHSITYRQIGVYDQLNKEEDKSHVIRLSYAISAGTIFQIMVDINTIYNKLPNI